MHLTKPEIDDIKARVDLVEVIGAVTELRKRGRYYMGRCPFHSPDKTPSLIADPNRQLWNCRGACSVKAEGKSGVEGKSGGDVFTFLMKLTGRTFPEVAEDLGARVKRNGTPLNGTASNGSVLNGTVPNGSAAVVPPNGSLVSPAPATGPALPAPGHFSVLQSRAPRTEIFTRALDVCARELATNLSAQDFLESRGLVTKELWRNFRLGYSSGALEELSGTESSEARRLLVDIGLLTPDTDDGPGGKERMKGRVIFPLLALNQLPVGLYGRSVKETHHPHHQFLPGPQRGLFNAGAARRSKEVLVVESVICALSLCEARVTNAMPLYGCHEPKEELFELLRRHAVTSVVVGLDGDEAGRRAAPGIAAAFRAMGFQARTIEWPEKDPNEVLVRHGAEKLREIAGKLLALPKACDLPARGTSAAESERPDDALDATTLDAPTNDAPVSVTAPDPPAHEPAPETTVTTSITPPPLVDLSVSSEAPAPGKASVKEEKPVAAGTSPSLATHPDGDLRSTTLTVRYEDRRYGLTWLESPSVAQLRAQTRLELLPEAADDGELPLVTFLDSINLASGRSRDGFIRRVLSLVSPEAEKLLPQKDALIRLVEADLMRLYELGERRMKALALPKAATNAMTDERRDRALSYLLTPDLLARLSTDLDAMGYVGERRAKLLGYLVSISRKLPEALSMVILSASGSGKSALADVLERLTPEEDLLVVSRFTAASLYWMGKDAMKRKFVSIEERGGSEEADYAIRALQSKKQLTMMAPIKDQASGKLETKFFFVEGPAAFLESTTESQIHHENATRCFEERLDESAEQTKRIHEAQRKSKTPEGQRAKARAEEIAALHRDVQRCLRVVKVSIPFADLLTFPSAWTRNRRDHPRFLNLIEVIAFLHQYQRPLRYLDTDELCERTPRDLIDEELAAVYVEASVEDYGAAKTLYAEILSETLAELKRPLRDLLSVFERMVTQKKVNGHENGFLLVRELRDATRLEQRVIRRYLAELVELEHLAQTRGPNGTANAYRLAELESRPAAEIEGLLSVEELRRRIEERRRQS